METIKIEVRKERGVKLKQNIYYNIYKNGEYYGCEMEEEAAFKIVKAIEDDFLKPDVPEIIYSKELTR